MRKVEIDLTSSEPFPNLVKVQIRDDQHHGNRDLPFIQCLPRFATQLGQDHISYRHRYPNQDQYQWVIEDVRPQHGDT